MNPNVKAFLDMIAVSEGTSTNPATTCNGYDVIVTGIDGRPEVFTSFKTHPFSNGRPPKRINIRGLCSSASGRYQFMLKDWKYYQQLLKLPDFGAVSQDTWAVQLIRERGAIPLIESGRFSQAVTKVSNLWASLPGAGYGQHENDLLKLQM